MVGAVEALTPAAAARRVAQLRPLIRHHDRLYYEQAQPEIADAEYDALVRELRALEMRFPALVTPDSPTQRVGGAPARAFRPVLHRAAMLSLESVTTPAALAEFARRIRRTCGVDPSYVCEPKVDGEPANRRLCRRLQAAGVHTGEAATRAPRGPLSNRTFVLTGTLSAYSRDEARRLIEAQGGRVTDAVTRLTDAVIVGEAPGRKLTDARRLGIRAVDEAAFRRLVERR